MNGVPIRAGGPADVEPCLDLWTAACAARDGQAFPGVAARARPKFDSGIAFFVAGERERVDGFVLATRPGTGMATDPEDAAVVGLLAVDPALHGEGRGRALLRAVVDRLSELGHEQAVLHALLDNIGAIQLYESEGWVAQGSVYEHSLLKRPLRTFARPLPLS